MKPFVFGPTKPAKRLSSRSEPFSTSDPLRGVQFREGASNWVDTPFLQATTFEHEHEHEHERRTPNAGCEALVRPMTKKAKE